MPFIPWTSLECCVVSCHIPSTHITDPPMMLRALVIFACLTSVVGFVPVAGNASQGSSGRIMTKSKNTVLQSSAASEVSAEALVNPTRRDAHYDGNVAQYLCDLHDSKSTFDFCGGMMFQRELSVGMNLVELMQREIELRNTVA